MLQLVKGKLAWRLAAMTVMVGLLFGVLCAGCGGGGGQTTPEQSHVQRYANLIINHDLAARTVGANVTKIVVSGFDASGTTIFDPMSFAKQAEISMRVPVETSSIRIEYYDATNALVGIYGQKVVLASNQEYVIADPAWQTPAEQTSLYKIDILPTRIEIVANEYARYTATGYFNTDGESYVQDLTKAASWTSYNDVVAQNLGNGIFLGLESGDTDIVAAFLNISASTKLVVSAPALREYRWELGNPVKLPVGYGLTTRSIIEGLYTNGSVGNLSKESKVVVADPTIVNVVVLEVAGDPPTYEFTPLAAGETTITATYVDGSGTSYEAVMTFIATEDKLVSFEAQWTELPVNCGEKFALGVMGHFGTDVVADVSGKLCGASIDSTKSTPGAATVVPKKVLIYKANAVGKVYFNYVPGVDYAAIPWINSAGETIERPTPVATIGDVVVKSISIEPVTVDLAIGVEKQFTAWAKKSDDTKEDYTDKVVWQSSATTKLAPVDGKAGAFKGVGRGVAKLTATYGVVTPGEATVNVK